jgi:hypothetical protein
MREYTERDYRMGNPCIHRWREYVATVEPIHMSERLIFCGGRRITFKFPNGYITSRNIGSGELTVSLWTNSQ